MLSPQRASVFRKLTLEENIMPCLKVQPISWRRRRNVTQLIDDWAGAQSGNNMDMRSRWGNGGA